MPELIDSMPEPSKRRNKEAVYDSCLSLIQACLSSFAQGKHIGYSDVKHLYQDSDAFHRDCKRIEKELSRLRPWLDAIGIPLPPVEYMEGRFHIPIRGFVARIGHALWEERCLLAKSLIAHQHKGKPLVPRTGTIYLGFGTTILAVAEHMCANLLEFDGISMSTSNIEILMRYYVLAPTILHRGHFLLPGGGEIDWNHGCVIPQERELEISTAIVSFEAMDEQGRFYADTHERRILVNKVLEKTRRRIILVGEKAKFAPSNCFEISLPVNNSCEIFLFTNGRPSRKYKDAIPDSVNIIVSQSDDPSNSVPPKKPR
jgi:hypothetical protein